MTDEATRAGTQKARLLGEAFQRAIMNALMKARDEPWSAEAPWVMGLKEWALHHGVEDPSGAMLWADLHVGTILHAVNNVARIEAANAIEIEALRRLAWNGWARAEMMDARLHARTRQLARWQHAGHHECSADEHGGLLCAQTPGDFHRAVRQRDQAMADVARLAARVAVLEAERGA